MDEPLTEEQIRSAIRSPEEPWEVDLFWMWHNGEIAGAGYLPDTDQRVGVPESHDELGFDPDAEEVVTWIRITNGKAIEKAEIED